MAGLQISQEIANLTQRRLDIKCIVGHGFEEQRAGLCLQQQVAPHPAKNAALASRGKEYFGKICFRCHGTDGRGNNEIARIAGQQPEYLVNTLTLYRDGKSPRAESIMTSNTRQMTDADIAGVAAYVSSMP